MYTALAFAGRSVWSQSVLATFVYLLRDNSSEAVGLITAVMGITQLLASFPAGIIADSHRRDSLLKVASGVGVLAIGATLAALWHRNFHYLIAALAVWGLCWGIGNTALSALFADSIRAGERSFYFTQRSILITIGNTTGPLVALSLFAILGDTWTIQECVVVMTVGQIICFPALLLLCFFSDDYIVSTLDDANDEACNELLTRDETISCQEAHLPPSEGDSETDSHDVTGEILFGILPKGRAIPILIASADMITGLGSGMSVRYFPIFFVQNLELSPVLVQVLYVTPPIIQALLMRTGQILAKRHGRCHVTVASKWIGICFMILMIAAYMAHVSKWYVCILYVLRTSFMNATSGLTRSVLMDNVPKEERGKWSALESVNMFSWSGSAALGGVLVGAVGLLPLFAVTAFVQFLSTLALVALFAHETVEDQSTETRGSVNANDDASSLATPPAASSGTGR
jgi:MFS family permease